MTVDNAGYERARAFSVLVMAQLAIGSAALLARIGLDGGLSPLDLSAWRLTIATLVLVLGLLFSRGSGHGRLEARARGRLVFAGCCLGIHFVAWFASLERISVARSTLLVTTSPLWAALGGWVVHRKRLAGIFWLGLAIALVGVFMVTGADPGPATTAPDPQAMLIGDLQAIGGAIAIAVYLLIVQELRANLTTAQVVLWTYSSAAFSLWIAMAFQGTDFFAWPGHAGWISILSMALIPQLMGHTALNWSLRLIPAGIVGASTLLEPVFAAALAWAFLAEPVTAAQVAGGLVLLLGVGITFRAAP